ncbi:MAG TPA: murein transglycosylase A [Burkholderiales bacterium]
MSFGPGPGRALAWSSLPGWDEARLADAWPALLNTCAKLGVAGAAWRTLCADAGARPPPDDAGARAFFERWFEPHRQRAGLFQGTGLITGYYEPLLNGSWTRSERYRYPIYRAPDGLLSVELGSVYPELKGKRVRGRLDGRRVVPYYSRAEIENGKSPLAGNELLWVDDPVELFLLHVQGSGRVRLASGEQVAVGYAQQNGHPYISIGRTLIERAGFALDEIDLPKIRAWLEQHPDQAQSLMNSNPSYVFFALRDGGLPGPLGSLGVPLLAQHAIAVDPNYIPLGTPVWLDTELPGDGAPYRKLVFAQDTGGAIKGPLRADLFFGGGTGAEDVAGRMKQRGRMYVLLPAQNAR